MHIRCERKAYAMNYSASANGEACMRAQRQFVKLEKNLFEYCVPSIKFATLSKRKEWKWHKTPILCDPHRTLNSLDPELPIFDCAISATGFTPYFHASQVLWFDKMWSAIQFRLEWGWRNELFHFGSYLHDDHKDTGHTHNFLSSAMQCLWRSPFAQLITDTTKRGTRMWWLRMWYSVFRIL